MHTQDVIQLTRREEHCFVNVVVAETGGENVAAVADALWPSRVDDVVVTMVVDSVGDGGDRGCGCGCLPWS
jgi:hypothetical protein